MSEIASAPLASAARAISGNVGDVGRELDDHGFARGRAAGAHDLFDAGHMGAEGHAARIDVGAADVDLVGIDPIVVIQRFDNVDVLLHAVAGHVDDDGHVVRGEPAQVVVLHDLNAGVLQADRIEHARRGFGDARARVAFPSVERNAFGRHRAELVDGNEVVVLLAGAEGARRNGHGVFHGETAEIDGHVHLCHLPHHL